MDTTPPKIALGTCAWSFDDWKGAFYPEHLPQGDRLEFYSRYLNAVEIDSTFYHTPAPYIAQRWMARTPDHFTFVCKMPREITHELKLRDCDSKRHAFLEGIGPLLPRLGCVLMQLPPSFTPKDDESAFRRFVMELPRDIRFAVEFRQREWHMPRIVRFLEENRICWVWNDMSPLAHQREAPFEFLPQTTDILYLSLMGDLETKYRSDRTVGHRYAALQWPRDQALANWAAKIRRHLAECSRVFVFANNHFEGFAPQTCRRLAKHLDIAISLPPPEPSREDEPDGQLDLL